MDRDPSAGTDCEARFAAAQEELKRNRRQLGHGAQQPNLLQGMLVCKQCGYACYRTGGKETQIGYYRCLGTDVSRFPDGVRCDNCSVRQAVLDALIWQSVIDLLCEPQLVHDEIERRVETAQNHSADRLREKQLLDERERLTKQHRRLLDAYQESLVELDELRRRALDAQLEELASATKDKENYSRPGRNGRSDH